LGNVLSVWLQVPFVFSSVVEGNVILQETLLPKDGRPSPKSLIERDWNTGMRIDDAEMRVL
jgi:hypothetical protein